MAGARPACCPRAVACAHAAPRRAARSAGAGAAARSLSSSTPRSSRSATQLQGRARITWTNRSRVPVDALFFHLYANAFANERTVFMREHGQSLRGTRLARHGGIDVLELRARTARTCSRARTPTSCATTPRRCASTCRRRSRPARASSCTRASRTPAVDRRAHGRRRRLLHDRAVVSEAGQARAGRTLGELPVSRPGRVLRRLRRLRAARARAEPAMWSPRPASCGEQRAPGGMRSDRYVLRSAVDVAWAAYPQLSRGAARRGGPQVDVFAPPGHGALAAAQAQLVQGTICELGAARRIPVSRASCWCCRRSRRSARPAWSIRA